MKKIFGCLLTLILLFNPYSIKAEEENSTEITNETWMLGVGIVVAGGFAYLGNKLGQSTKKKKSAKK